MAELLLEIASEEIPARMQTKAAKDLGRLLGDALGKAGLDVENMRTFSGPRRLVFVADIPEKSPDIREERKGPRVGAPEQALAGFMRGAGLADIGEAQMRSDKKGEYYVAVIEKSGQDAREIVASAVPEIMSKFPWPKSMKSGSNPFRWVRPLSSILCILDGEIIPFEIGGIRSGNTSFGHRRMGHGQFSCQNFQDYRATLETKGRVILDADQRAQIILRDAKDVCARAGLELVEDIGLLGEVAGLVEWPVVILGDMAPEFLQLPADVIKLSMRSHQKYFAVRNPKTQALAPHFVVVANQDAPDGGEAIAKGNARVLSARLDDARFFEQEDAKRPLESRFIELDGVIFHQKLGTIKDKAERVAALANALAPKMGADPKKAAKAAKLAKCDLVTHMVVEFTSLQGKIGRIMYEREGGDADIALAIEEHYKPQGPSDSVPKNPVSACVALADKLDTLVGFWAIDEKPTGSKDPFGLRRAALGVVRILLENGVRVNLDTYMDGDLFPFILERLKVYLRDQGIAHDHIDAVFAWQTAGSENKLDDLVDITNRIYALRDFLSSDDGANLLAGYKRAANILKAEAKKGKLPDSIPTKGTQPEEGALFCALETATPKVEKELARENYAEAMTALASLRAPIDRFFENVTVNSEIPTERKNRLGLLMEIRKLARMVADFDKIEG